MTFLKKALATTAIVAVSSTAAIAGSTKAKNAGITNDTTIVEAAVATPELSTLVTAVKAADLAETLGSEGPFTVFAPTNAAFKKLPDGTVDTLLKPENKDQLAGVLTYHVVPGDISSKDVVDNINKNGGEFSAKTVAGGELIFKMEGENVAVVDENGNTSIITIADLDQKNGQVHVIDTVLLPSSS